MNKLNYCNSSFLLLFLLLTSFSYGQITHDSIMASIRKDLRRTGVRVITVPEDFCAERTYNTLDQRVMQHFDSQNSDGSWEDINYKDSLDVNGWEPLTHLRRLLYMADAYSSTTSDYHDREDLLIGIQKGLDLYYDEHPKSTSWYTRELKQPQQICKILIMARGGTSPVTSDTEQKLLKRLDSLGPPRDNRYTGANKLEYALWYFYKGLLNDNAEDVDSAVDEVYDEIFISTEDGLQPDYSFYQHGPQLNMLNYGTTYLSTINNFAKRLSGTTYKLTDAKLDIYRNFVLGPYSQVSRGRYSSFNAKGRAITRLNSINANRNIILEAIDVDPDNAAAYRTIYDRMRGNTEPSYNITAQNSYLYRSQYTTHNRTDYNIDIRANSFRTKKTEGINGENLRGRFLSEGATNIVVNGDEYFNIFPVWDWNKIPGTTVPAYSGSDLKPFEGTGELGNATFSGGVSNGLYGVQVFDMDDYDTQVKKAWFLFDEEVVCLGTGINSTATEVINTTINQSHLDGPVTVSQGGASNTLSSGSHHFPSGVEWVLHDSIGYFIPKGGNLRLSNQVQSGSWYDINTRYGCADVRQKDVFKLWFDHGTSPSDDSYAYILAPGKTTVQQMANYNLNNVNILRNDSGVQAVKHNGLDMIQVVFYSPGTLSVGDMILQADKACTLILNNVSTSSVSVSAADPSESLENLNISWSSPSISPMRSLQVSLPTNEADRGSSVQGVIDLTSSINNVVNIETFEDVNMPDLGSLQTYTSSDNSFDWTVQHREIIGRINATKQIYFQGNGEIGVQSGIITGGIGSFSVEVLDLWNPGNERELELLINGTVVGTSTHTGTGAYSFSVSDINIEGDFTMAIRNTTPWPTSGGRNKVAIDNISWTSYVAPPITSADLYPEHDAYVQNGSSSGNNFGSDERLVVKNANQNGRREVFLLFDLSEMPLNATSAILKLKLRGTNAGAVNTSWDVSSVTDDNWTEDAITWDTKPASITVLNNQPGQESGYVEWDITSFVNAELSGDKTISLKISSTSYDSSTYASFSSKEENSLLDRPILDLRYDPIVQLPAGHDAFVRNGDASDSNYGSNERLVLKRNDTNSGREGFIQFNLPEANSSVLTSATLKMNIRGAYPGAVNTTWDVSSVANDSWKEGTITWNNKPAAGAVLDNQPGQETGSVEWDVTNFVDAQLNGDGKVSFRISSTSYDPSTYAAFASKEHGTAVQRPVLELSFSPSSSSSSSSSTLKAILPPDENGKTLNLSEESSIIEESNIIKVYPNPVEYEFTVESKTPITQLSIIDMTGKTIKLIRNVKSTNFKVDVSDFNRGLYFIKTQTDDGATNTHKIIKR